MAHSTAMLVGMYFMPTRCVMEILVQESCDMRDQASCSLAV